MKTRLSANAAALCLATATLSGCAGPRQAHYYTLPPVSGQGESAIPATAATQEKLIYLRAVRIPELMKRPEIVARRAGTNTVDIQNDALWAGDISAAVAKQFALALEQAQPGSLVFNAPLVPDAEPDLFYTIEIERLDGVRGGNVELQMRWTARESAAGRTEHGRYSETLPTENDSVDAYVATLSELIRRAALSLSEHAD
ncbi:PqiC family protein [Granulosicoccaceae sp. 1_MG-2023]|nr:PqiC family protein [Granulosicoccaceae sp. 1_MG-2023]